MDGTRKSQGIQVIARAADVLRALAASTAPLSLGQIAGRVGLPRSTVQRIVAALAEEGLVAAGTPAGGGSGGGGGGSGGSGVRLGPAIGELAEAARGTGRARLRAVMERLSAETGETVDLAVLDGGRMLFLDQIVGRHRLRAVSHIGERFPLTTTANGKAALACLPVAEAERLIDGELDRDRPAGVSRAALLTELEAIRAGAPARDTGSHTEGISALGFAVREADGTICALSVPCPTSRFVRIEPELAAALSRARAEVAG